MPLIEAIRVVAHARLAVGMHGSVLILTMFMQSGSTVRHDGYTCLSARRDADGCRGAFIH